MVEPNPRLRRDCNREGNCPHPLWLYKNPCWRRHRKGWNKQAVIQACRLRLPPALRSHCQLISPWRRVLVATATVSTGVPVPGAATVLAERVVVTPAGVPETASVNAALKPVCAVVARVIGVELAKLAVRLVLLGASVNDGAPIVTGRLNVPICPALVPLIVNV